VGATLAGTTTAAAVAGVAIFSNLSIDRSGTYTLVATAPGLTEATSAPFTVPLDACWSRLVFTVQPSNTAAGAVITPPLQVCAIDGFGNTATWFVGNVTIAIGNNPVGGTLTGTLTRAVVSGCASFSDLSIDKAGSGYTLTAASTALPPAVSALFTIGP
jgi:hypothetical protein